MFSITNAEDIQTSHTVVAQPAMFGRRWSKAVKAAVKTVDFDLCDWSRLQEASSSTSESASTTATTTSTANDADIDNSHLHDETGNPLPVNTALFYDAQSLGDYCEYAEMAQVAEFAFPSASYLLVSQNKMLPMTKPDDLPDTTMGLATINAHDTQGLFVCFVYLFVGLFV